MTPIVTLLAGVALSIVAWRWSMLAAGNAARVALVAVLGTMAAAFNLIVPVPSIEATTTVVLGASIALGARMGTAVGMVAVLGSSIAGGVGAWTIWQLVAVALVACIGSLVGGRADHDWYQRTRRIRLGAIALVATVAWDIVVTVGGAASYATAPGLTRMEQVAASLLLGIAFTVVHAVFTTAFTVVGGPPLLHALERARPRLDGGVVLGVRPARA